MDELIDWDTMLRLRKGADVDVDADHDAVLNDDGPGDDDEMTLLGVIVLCYRDDDDATIRQQFDSHRS